MPPPVFPNGKQTDAQDVALARALFLALDPESQRSFARCCVFADLCYKSNDERRPCYLCVRRASAGCAPPSIACHRDERQSRRN
jgi:hypothetical protein